MPSAPKRYQSPIGQAKVKRLKQPAPKRESRAGLYGRLWDKTAKGFLRASENALCVICRRKGRIEPAKCVDHITPHKGDPVLFWEATNWQGLCLSCHSRKTAQEDGGFGNPIRRPK
ncbi:MAG: HNH endonuclease [Planctomycetota bacterium]